MIYVFSESHTFNFLEIKSRDPEPKTPILNCRLSRSLEPLSNPNTPSSLNFSRKYKRSVINWVTIFIYDINFSNFLLFFCNF